MKKLPLNPTWHPYLAAYREKKWLVFSSQEDLEAAIDLLWTDSLFTLPHDTPDGRSLIVPVEAVPYFERSGIPFTVHEIRSINDLDSGTVEELR